MQPDLKPPEPSTTVGGTLCLDFINANLSSYSTEPGKIAPYANLTSWGLELGFLSSGQAKHLEQLARDHPERAADTMKRTKWLREILHRIFSNLAANLEPLKSDLEELIEAHARAVAIAKLKRVVDTYRLCWEIKSDIEVVLYVIVHDAIRLLGDATLERVKACPDCGWLFVDSSKNRSRRWCRMDTCGARDKMRRYYRRGQDAAHIKGSRQH
jgi:predicted RNA-binding Zn ribbon-like protein